MDDGGAEIGGEEALVVIFEGDGGDGEELGFDVGEKRGLLFSGEGAGGFLIEAEHLLGVAVLGEADEAGFGSGGTVSAAEDAVGGGAHFLEDIDEEAALHVVAADADHDDLGTEGGETSGDIAGAAGALFAVAFLDDGDGGFGAEAFGVAVDVFIDHDVADEQDARVGEALYNGGEVGGGGQHWFPGSRFNIQKGEGSGSVTESAWKVYR